MASTATTPCTPLLWDSKSRPTLQYVERARNDSRVLISADSHFGTILASTRAVRPSILYIRRVQGRRVEQLVAVIVDNLDAIKEAFGKGSVVVLGEGSVRSRRLPIL